MGRRHYYWLQLASAHLRKRANRDLEASGLTVTQLGALFVIAGRGRCLLKDLAEELHINASAVTTLAGRLDRAGLIRIDPSERDRRASEISLTEAGKQAIADAQPLLGEMNSRLEADFTPDELEVVGRFLRTCVALAGETPSA